MSAQNRPLRSGGLIPAERIALTPETGPLRHGPDVSWLPRCLPGDDQGQSGACAVFSMASWAEIMHGLNISDSDALRVYGDALHRLGREYGGGLTFAEAFAASGEANWLPGASGIRRVTSLDKLIGQPLLAGYVIAPAWDNVSGQGCLDHMAPSQPVRGYHAVVIVGHGTLTHHPSGPWVYVENSWGSHWGWKGIGVMSIALHRRLCNEIWEIV